MQLGTLADSYFDYFMPLAVSRIGGSFFLNQMASVLDENRYALASYLLVFFGTETWDSCPSNLVKVDTRV